MAGLVWTNPPDVLLPTLGQRYRDAVQRGVRAIANRYAPEIENWLRDNAPWTDRTGNARQSLHVAVTELANGYVELVLAHGVEYGWYLEGINPATMTPMANAGEWAVIDPALDVYGPVIWARVVELVRP